MVLITIKFCTNLVGYFSWKTEWPLNALWVDSMCMKIMEILIDLSVQSFRSRVIHCFDSPSVLCSVRSFYLWFYRPGW